MTTDAPYEYPAERAKAFIDAVVAIAMTLLILPLMESTGELTNADQSATGWFATHQWQLISFVLSFVIIGMFWLTHQRLFAGVERVTSGFLWICLAWLLTIVWLPVATALAGRADSDDRIVNVVYIGSMILTAFVSLIQRLYLQRHAELHTLTPDALRSGIAADASTCALFAVALVVAALVPAIGYSALLVMLLSGPVQQFLRRTLSGRTR